jgi:hypothetical protein
MGDNDLFNLMPKKYKQKALDLQEKMEAATVAMDNCAEAVRENTAELKKSNKAKKGK